MSEKIFINVADLTDPNDPEGRTYREVNHSMQHAYDVGDLVELDNGVRVFIALQTRDCDGTPLYCLTPKENDFVQTNKSFANHNWLNGYGEDSIARKIDHPQGASDD